jgi:dihydrofolate reductase
MSNKVFDLFREMKYRRMVEYRQIRGILDEGASVGERVIAAVVAVDSNWGIGRGGGLLVHLPDELKHFKEITFGNIVVMGRRTFESLPGGALTGRINVVLSRSMSEDEVKIKDEVKVKGLDSGTSPRMTQPMSSCAESQDPDLIIERDFSEMIANLKELQIETGKDIFFIGGGSIYRECLPYIDRAYVTKINEEFDADTFFPNLDAADEFKLSSESEWISEGYHKYRYCVYERR